MEKRHVRRVISYTIKGFKVKVTLKYTVKCQTFTPSHAEGSEDRSQGGSAGTKSGDLLIFLKNERLEEKQTPQNSEPGPKK
jgi:hypothetical protein